uniref:Endonuclease n=1 Tax=Strongyloides venezuelensis TaxID=75913 RepID=A0A0K0FBS9_STRVS
MKEHQFQMMLPFLKGRAWSRLYNHGYRYQTLSEGLYDLECAVKIDKPAEKSRLNKNSQITQKFTGECNYCHKVGHKAARCHTRINDAKKALNTTADITKNTSNVSNSSNKYQPQIYHRNNFILKSENVKLPLIEVNISKGCYTALIDTGANVGIIRESITLRHGLEVTPCDDIVRQTFGTESRSLGKTVVSVKIKDKICELELLCVKDIYMDDIYDLLLDTNAIVKFNLNINLAQKKIIMDKKSIDLIEVVKPNSHNMNNIMLREPMISNEEAFKKLNEVLPKLPEFYESCNSYTESVFTAPRQSFYTDIPHKFVRYHIPVKLLKYIDEELDYLIDNKIIIPSDTPYLHNMILVKKSDNTYRPCSDMRETNKITVVDQYPVADLRETLSSLQGYTLFSTIDIKKAFQLIAIQPEDQPRFGIYCHRGTFQYTKLPFGYVNSAQIFQRAIDSCLQKGNLNKVAKAYFDDILVRTNQSIEHHIKTVASVLSVLIECNLAVNFKKCRFACKSIEFLGHLIDGNGMSPSHANRECIRNMKIEKSITGIKRFLGATGFFCNLIPSYSRLCEPLTFLLSPKNQFKWTNSQDKAIEALKSALIENCTVAHPNFNLPFEIYVDSSMSHHGAVIMQRDKNNVLLPVRYWSMKRKFTKKHRSSVYVELEGIVQLCRRFKYYLLGNKNIVYTDHKGLVKIISSSTDITFSQWLYELQPFQITFKYIPGFKNIIADFFSRPTNILREEENEVIMENDSDMEIIPNQEFVINNVSLNNTVGRCFTSDYLVDKQSKDEDLMNVAFCKKHNIVMFNGIYGVFKDQSKKVFIPFLPNTDLYDTCVKIHSMGHFKLSKIVKLISMKWFNPKIYLTLRDIESKCESCLKTNVHHQPKIRKVILLYDMPRIAYSVDLAGPWNNPLSKFRYVCMVIDIFSRFWMPIPLVDSSFSSIAQGLKTVFNRYGMPKLLRMDNATYFRCHQMQEFAESNNIKIEFADPYVHTNVMAERAIRSLEEMISRCNGNNQPFETLLEDMMFYYNASPNMSTGITPYELFFAGKCHMPYEFCQNIEPTLIDRDYAYYKLKENALIAYNNAYITLLNNRLKYSKNINIKKTNLPVGTLIYVKKAVRDSKLKYSYEGPFEVVSSDFLSVSYRRIEKKKYQRNSVMKCHISQVKLVDKMSFLHNLSNEEKREDNEIPLESQNVVSDKNLITKKNVLPDIINIVSPDQSTNPAIVKRKRGRPRKNNVGTTKSLTENTVRKVKRRGRKPKSMKK